MFTSRPGGAVSERSSKGSQGDGDVVYSLIKVMPRLQIVLETNERVLAASNNMTLQAISPIFHAKAFPENVRPDLLELIELIATQIPEAKPWKREIAEAFNDVRIFVITDESMAKHWFPVLRRWSLSETSVVSDILARILAPAAAGLMFGVGASSARLAADRAAQQNLRRTALLLLCNDKDSLAAFTPVIEAKLTELYSATVTSSPSSTTRAEMFMVLRALFLSTEHIHLAGLWPMINSMLETAILSTMPEMTHQDTYNNLSLLQACKLLDLLVTIQPDDFQLQEWIFLTNTIDAGYSEHENKESALVDQVARTLTSSGTAPAVEEQVPAVQLETAKPGLKRPMFSKLKLDSADVKVMVREDFVRQTLLPFLSGLSINAYEQRYQMGAVDWEACRADLIRDLMDRGTVV